MEVFESTLVPTFLDIAIEILQKKNPDLSVKEIKDLIIIYVDKGFFGFTITS